MTRIGTKVRDSQISLGITDTTTGLLKLEFKYEGADPSGTVADRNNGSMREQKITVPTVGENEGFTATQTYTYDALNRIYSAEEEIASSTTWKQTFDIDRYGNRRFNTSGSNTTTLGSCPEAICNPTVSTSNNKLTSSGYAYDENGNLIEDAEDQRFGYDAENHQKEFFSSTNSGSTPDAIYHYDGEGKRVKKVVGEEVTVFVYDASSMLVAEYSTELATTQQVSYLTTDQLGSARIITNENGVVTDRKDYSAFGEATVTSERIGGLGYTSADETRKGYTGYEKDSESQLEFAQARYYKSQHGRFTTVDPLDASIELENPQSFNRYAYVANDPYNFTDPSGLMACGAADSYGQCGGDQGFWGSGSFGSDVAAYNRNHAWLPPGVQRGLHDQIRDFQRWLGGSQYIGGYTWDTGSASTTFSPGHGWDGLFDKWTGRFNIPVAMNDRGQALFRDLGRRGPALQKITNAAGAFAIGVIAIPIVADVVGAVVASQTAKAIAENLAKRTIAEQLANSHIFRLGNTHNLGPLLARFGSEVALIGQVATTIAGRLPAANGPFTLVVRVAGYRVVVTGAMVNGQPHISNFWIP